MLRNTCCLKEFKSIEIFSNIFSDHNDIQLQINHRKRNEKKIILWRLNNMLLEIKSVQFSSVTQSCLTLCDPMNCSMAGFPVHHQLSEFTQTHVHWSVMPSNHLILCHPFSSCLKSFPAWASFQMSQLFPSGGQSIGVSASTSVLPRNTRTDL